MRIGDGKGRGKDAAVTLDHRLETEGKDASHAFFVSRDEAQAYHWVGAYSASSADTVMYLKNTNKTKNLYINHVTMSSEAGRATWTLHQASGTASGTTITGKNMNLTSSNSANVVAMGDAAVTGISLGDKIDIIASTDDSTIRMEMHEGVLILGFNDAIAVSFVGSTGTVNGVIGGFFEEITT